MEYGVFGGDESISEAVESLGTATELVFEPELQQSRK